MQAKKLFGDLEVTFKSAGKKTAKAQFFAFVKSDGSLFHWVKYHNCFYHLAAWCKKRGSKGNKWELVVWVGEEKLYQWALKRGINLLKKKVEPETPVRAKTQTKVKTVPKSPATAGKKSSLTKSKKR